MVGRCVYRLGGDAFWRYHDWIFDHTRCIETRATEGEVEKSLAEARKLGVTKLPTIFVNGRRIDETVDWDGLRGVIDGEISRSRPAIADSFVGRTQSSAAGDGLESSVEWK